MRSTQYKLVSIYIFVIGFVILGFAFPAKAFAGCTVFQPDDPNYCTANIGCDCNIYWSSSTHLCVNDNPDYSRPCTVSFTPPVSGHFAQHQEWECPNGENACGGGGDSCFLSGTKVKMESGEKNIEEVKQGEVLVSFDPQSQKESLNVVREPYSVTRDHYYTIKTASGKEVKATDEHPFYTGEKSVVQKSFIQKVQASINILYIYLQDGWQVVKIKAS